MLFYQANHSSSRKFLFAIAAVIFLIVPFVTSKGFVLSFLIQIAIVSVFALSFNMLLGQTGLLSFGHAVYSGIGAYCSIHFMNKFGVDSIGLWLVGLPLIGGIGGAIFSLIFGYISTRRAGTVFAMITLGIAEMVVALALMLPGVFGGEAGITTNRMLSKPFFGISFGSASEIYYLAVFWAIVAGTAMYAFTLTPLGRLANAVRDNSERAAFVGFNPRRIRLTVMVIAGFFAGIAGSLSVLNYELVTAENLGIGQSGIVLIATYLGGIGYFLGPILGAFIYVFFLAFVSTLTKAWLLYFGMLFIAIVLFAPDGLGSFISRGSLKNLGFKKLGIGAIGGAIIIAFIEKVYSLQESGPGDAGQLITSVTEFRQHFVLTTVTVVVFVAVGLYRLIRKEQRKDVALHPTSRGA